MNDLIDRNASIRFISNIERDNEDRLFTFEEIKKMLRDAPAVNRWIPCSERLPNEAGEYIVCGKWSEEKPRTWICLFAIFGDIGGFVNSAKNPPISFWMPKPEPPEREGDTNAK